MKTLILALGIWGLAVCVEPLLAQRKMGPVTVPGLAKQSTLKSVMLDDLDGDGHADYAIANREITSPAYQSGRVQVISSQSGVVLATHWGPIGYSSFAEFIHAADFDGDGRLDILVAVPYSLPARIDVLDALSGAVIGVLSSTSTYNFGSSMDSLDVDGDGKEEILTCGFAPAVSSVVGLQGTVFVFQGGTGALLKLVTGIELDGAEMDCKFLGDVTGEGQPEIAVNMVSQNDPRGQAFEGRHSVWDILTLGIKIHENLSPAANTFVSGLTIVSDRNGDSINDYSVSSSNGLSYVHHQFSGATGAQLAVVNSMVPLSNSLWPIIRNLPDLDGDGLTELGAMYTPYLTTDPLPRVAVYSSTKLALIDEYLFPGTPVLGFSDLVLMPDLDGDGFEDLLVNDPAVYPIQGPMQRRSLAPALAPQAAGNHLSGLELLKVNASEGGIARRVDLAIGQAFNISFAADNTIAGPTDFIIFGMLGRPNTSTTYSSSFGDFVVTPRPSAIGNPNLFTLVDSLGYDPLAVFPAAPAPYALVAPLGLSGQTEFSLQGVSVTGAIPNVAISNAILIRVL